MGREWEIMALGGERVGLSLSTPWRNGREKGAQGGKQKKKGGGP